MLKKLVNIWKNITRDQAAHDQLIKDLAQRMKYLADHLELVEWQVKNNKQ